MKRPTEAFWIELGTMAATLDSTNYYQILGVDPCASQETLQSTFERYVQVLHPDRHMRQSGERRQMLTRVYARMSEGYRVLTHPKRRQQYDLGLATGQLRWQQTHHRPNRAQRNTPRHPQALSLFQKSQVLLEKNNYKAAKAQLLLAKQYDPNCEAISALLQLCEPPPRRKGTKPPPVVVEPQRHRVHKRAPLGRIIRVTCTKWEEVRNIYVENISKGGMYLQSTNPPEIGSILEIAILTPEEESIELPAEVMRLSNDTSSTPHGFGIRFLTIPNIVRARFEILLVGAGLSIEDGPT